MLRAPFFKIFGCLPLNVTVFTNALLPVSLGRAPILHYPPFCKRRTISPISCLEHGANNTKVMDLIPIWVIQSWTRSSLWVPFNSECSVILILACADPNYQLCCARRVSWACWHSSVPHTNCSLSWKWLWLILRKISTAPFTHQNSNTAVQVPNLSEPIFSWKIFLAYPSRKVWNIKKTFHSMELFFFLYTDFREEIRNWLRGREERER